MDSKIIFPRASDFKSAEDYFNHINNSRDACQERGYHKVSQDDKNPLICYDCDLWFEKEDEIKYKVESPL